MRNKQSSFIGTVFSSLSPLTPPYIGLSPVVLSERAEGTNVGYALQDGTALVVFWLG